MPRVPLLWYLPLSLLVGCRVNRTFPIRPPAILTEDNIIILKHIGVQTWSVPVLVLLPDADALQHELHGASINHVPRAAFDSACAYYNAQLPVLQAAMPACQRAYDGGFGAYKVTVKHQGFVTVHYLSCRDCTQATFATLRNEQAARPAAPTIVRKLAAAVANFTSP
jgi:hypothetical protein